MRLVTLQKYANDSHKVFQNALAGRNQVALVVTWLQLTTPRTALNETHLPTSPTSGYSHWHLGPSLGYTSADDVLDVRFYCSTSRHSRVMHFKTSNQYVRSVAVSGNVGSGNAPTNWNTGWTALEGHSAYLPAATTSTNNNRGFTSDPFSGYYGYWYISSYSAHCDDFGRAGSSSHQVWARLPGVTRLHKLNEVILIVRHAECASHIANKQALV